MKAKVIAHSSLKVFNDVGFEKKGERKGIPVSKNYMDKRIDECVGSIFFNLFFISYRNIDK